MLFFNFAKNIIPYRASRYEASVSLKFKRNCREYYGRFYWSGSGEGKIKIKNRGFTLNILKRRTRYIEYVIVFDRTYRKGESVTLNLFGIMDDETGQFSPYFSTTIDTPTDTLVIKLKIDYKKYPIEQIEREIIPPQCFDHTGAEKIDVQVEGEYVWEIPKPRVSYQYSFNWTFASKKDSLYEREGVKMGD